MTSRLVQMHRSRGYGAGRDVMTAMVVVTGGEKGERQALREHSAAIAALEGETTAGNHLEEAE